MEDEYVRRCGAGGKSDDDPLGYGPGTLAEKLAMEIVSRMPRFDNARDAVLAVREEWNRLNVEVAEARIAADAKRMASVPNTHTYRGVPVTEDQFKAFAALDGYGWPKK